MTTHHTPAVELTEQQLLSLFEEVELMIDRATMTAGNVVLTAARDAILTEDPVLRKEHAAEALRLLAARAGLASGGSPDKALQALRARGWTLPSGRYDVYRGRVCWVPGLPPTP